MSLSVVADRDPMPAKPETVAERVRRLQAEAKGAARDHIAVLIRHLAQVQQTAAEISDGGEVYPAGVRDIASRLVDDTEARIATLDGLMTRLAR